MAEMAPWLVERQCAAFQQSHAYVRMQLARALLHESRLMDDEEMQAEVIVNFHVSAGGSGCQHQAIVCRTWGGRRPWVTLRRGATCLLA